MRLRTFTASDMPSAMKLVREELGENAIILSSEQKAGKKLVTVTAAIEEDEEEGLEIKVQAPSYKPQALNDIRFELQEILRFHNLPELFIAKMLQKITGADITELLEKRRGSEELFRPALERLLARNFVFDPLRFLTTELRLMLVGTAGIGKTLTIAKLATKLSMDKQSVAVITTDNTRAGGIEQLQAFTNILGLELHIANGRKDLEKILKSLPARMRVLIDTAGVAPYDGQEFAELQSIATLPDIEPILVLPAGGDSMETIDIVEVFRSLPIRRLLVTRADATRRFGGILAAAAAHGLGFCNISRSASITDNIQPLEPNNLAQMLLKYKN
jgi:flagellar biosynthesis protein FlhF